jgi:hypothetical protein
MFKVSDNTLVYDEEFKLTEEEKPFRDQLLQ